MFTFTPALALAVLGFTPPTDAPIKPDCGCEAGAARTWVVIDEDQVVLSHKKLSDAELEKLPKGALVVACSQFRSEAMAVDGQQRFRLHCQDAHFRTGRGFSGRAERLAYDSGSGLMELRGHNAGVMWESPADEMSLVAEKMLINLKQSEFRLAGAVSLETAANTVCQCAAGACSGKDCCCASKPVKQTAKECPMQPKSAPAFHAHADEISYDAAQGLYIFRSKNGNGHATIWQPSQPAGPATRFDGQPSEFVSGENQSRVLRTIGLLPRFRAPCSYPDSRARSADDGDETADDAATNVLQIDIFRALR